MAKTSMKIKQQRAPKFSTRAYTRCRICGRPHSVLKKYGICRVCFRELAYKGEIPYFLKYACGRPQILQRLYSLVENFAGRCCLIFIEVLAMKVSS